MLIDLPTFSVLSVLPSYAVVMLNSGRVLSIDGNWRAGSGKPSHPLCMLASQ